MNESVTYVCNCPDYTVEFTEILDKLDAIISLLGTFEGFLIFGIVVVLCIFVYKFFRMFF